MKIVVTEMYKHIRKVPFPKTIKLREDNLVVFYDTLTHVSLYSTDSDSSTLEFKHPHFIDYTKDRGDIRGNNLKYGPFKYVDPLSYQELRVHFKHNYPMPVFK